MNYYKKFGESVFVRLTRPLIHLNGRSVKVGQIISFLIERWHENSWGKILKIFRY